MPSILGEKSLGLILVGCT
jgi:hypothetical protein